MKVLLGNSFKKLELQIKHVHWDKSVANIRNKLQLNYWENTCIATICIGFDISIHLYKNNNIFGASFVYWKDMSDLNE